MLKTAGPTINVDQQQKLDRFAQSVAQAGANVYVYDTDGEIVLHHQCHNFESNADKLYSCATEVFQNGSTEQKVCDADEQIISGALKIDDKIVLAIVIDSGQYDSRNRFLRIALDAFVEQFNSNVRISGQVEMISAELAQTYEELMLLHKMSSNMKVTRSDANYLQVACDSLRELVDTEGIAIIQEKSINGHKRLIITAGTGLISLDDDCGVSYEILHDYLMEELGSGKEALLDSEVDSAFKYDWPENVRNIIAVPMYINDRVIGLMVAVNRIGKQDFDSIDMKLFVSIANECAIFIENDHLFQDLKELFIGSLKALTSSIDAKDRYTRGHSDRVAFISRWLAEKYSEQHDISVEQIHRIYLAGLMHDVGKIGIDEAVLTKPGKLTDAEYYQIKSHPSIGAGILGGIKQMSEIVPGVLYHHERVDGKGYPNGITDKDIPLIGKIVMIADAFDAMTSRRSYRNAMNLQTAVTEIKSALGTQFDEELGRLFIQSDIHRLWQILQNENVEDYYGDDFSDYGIAAVGALLR